MPNTKYLDILNLRNNECCTVTKMYVFNVSQVGRSNLKLLTTAY